MSQDQKDLPVAVQTMNIVDLVRYYMAHGYSGPKITLILENKHNIKRSNTGITNMMNDIREGKYDTTFFDGLLSTYLPELYASTVTRIEQDLQDLDEMAKTCEDEKVKFSARRAHATISINMLKVIHQGPVVREMRKLATSAKELAKEVLKHQAAIESRGKLVKVDESAEVQKKFITLDENLQKITEESTSIADNLENQNKKDSNLLHDTVI